MINPAECFLDFVPSGDVVKARIVSLSTDDIAEGLRNWWNDPAIVLTTEESPIDRYWDWADAEIEFEGKILASELVGVLTDDGYVQGAMPISWEPIASVLAARTRALLVELLFTAPRNRSHLRIDGRKYFGGVGPELLRWAMEFSRSLGYEGRLRLFGSPDYVNWYKRQGFVAISVEPLVFEGVEYIAMELSAENAARLARRGGE